MSEEDTGAADPALAAALAAWTAEPSPRHAALVYAAVVEARLLVPVVATLVESETAPATGLQAEKTSEMAVVTMVGRSGATALPAFTSTATMRRWRLDARPVAVRGREACLAALDGGHSAVVVEPRDAAFVLSGSALRSLAEGYVPAASAGEPERMASRRVDDDLRLSPPASPAPGWLGGLRAALAAEPAVAEAYLLDAAVADEEPGPVVGLVLHAGTAPAELPALVTRLADAVAPDGLDVAVLAPRQRVRAREVGVALVVNLGGQRTGPVKRSPGP